MMYCLGFPSAQLSQRQNQIVGMAVLNANDDTAQITFTEGST